MQRVLFSLNPKGPRLLFEAAENAAATWSLKGDLIRLHDDTGAAFAEGPMELLGAKYLPQLDAVRVTSIAADGQQNSLMLSRHDF